MRCYGEDVGELKGNIVGTREKWKKHPFPHKLKREKTKAPWVHAWAFPLAAWNSSSQKSLSPLIPLAKNTLLLADSNQIMRKRMELCNIVRWFEPRTNFFLFRIQKNIGPLFITFRNEIHSYCSKTKPNQSIQTKIVSFNLGSVPYVQVQVLPIRPTQKLVPNLSKAPLGPFAPDGNLSQVFRDPPIYNIKFCLWPAAPPTPRIPGLGQSSPT